MTSTSETAAASEALGEVASGTLDEVASGALDKATSGTLDEVTSEREALACVPFCALRRPEGAQGASRHHAALHNGASAEAAEALRTLGARYGVRPCYVPADAGIAVFRSRALDGADARDVQALADLGITDIFDLRKSSERDEHPVSAAINSTFAVHICPLGSKRAHAGTPDFVACNARTAYGKPGERMIRQYRLLAHESEHIGRIVADVLEAGKRGGVLVHCASGKDRTGIVCASLQRALGVPDAAIMADYLTANDYNRANNLRDLAHEALYRSADELEVLAAMYQARPEYLRAYFSEANRLAMYDASARCKKKRFSEGSKGA